MIADTKARWAEFICKQLLDAVLGSDHFLWRIPSTQVTAMQCVLSSDSGRGYMDAHIQRALKILKLSQPASGVNASYLLQYEQALLNARIALKPSSRFKYTKSDFRRAITVAIPGIEWRGDFGQLERDGFCFVIDLTDGLKRLLRYWRPLQISYEGVLCVGSGELDNVFSVDLDELVDIVAKSFSLETVFIKDILRDDPTDWITRKK